MNYRENCPPDRALVASDGKKVRVLDFIGPGFEEWEENVGLNFELEGIEAGLWLIQGHVDGWETYEGDWDASLEITHKRPLTQYEWDWYLDVDPETGPWDRGLWRKDSEPETGRPSDPDIPEGWE